MRTQFFEPPLRGSPTKFAIATTEEEFNHIQRRNVDHGEQQAWIVSGARSAVTHYFDRLVVVCLPLDTPEGVLVHESVHVFSHMMLEMGEEKPSEEFTAYGIEYIYETMSKALAKRRRAWLEERCAPVTE